MKLLFRQFVDFVSTLGDVLCLVGPSVLFLGFAVVFMLRGVRDILRSDTRLSGVGDILGGLTLVVVTSNLLLLALNSNIGLKGVGGPVQIFLGTLLIIWTVIWGREQRRSDKE